MKKAFGVRTGSSFITLLPHVLATGSKGNAYVDGGNPVQITAEGGVEPHAFSVLGIGLLPPGLMLAEDGTISGVPKCGGTFNVAIQARDAQWCIGIRTYKIIINELS